MKKSILVFCFISFLGNSILVQSQNIAERLGYPKNSKLLIIHADDLGVANSENKASIAALENSVVNSASIMVPTPWFSDIAVYARKNKNADLGLHLTLNSEWDNYKWGPVTSRNLVPGLVNKNGFFYSSVDSLHLQGTVQEVALELRNQIEKAYAFGIDVTHLDAHMGAATSKPEYLETYIRLGKEYKLPVLLNKQVYARANENTKKMFDDNTIIIDQVAGASPNDFDAGMAAFYTDILSNMKPGLTCLITHLAYDDDEMKAVAINHAYWGAAWRQADYDFFTSTACADLIKKENIILVTWRTLRDKIVRAE